MKEKDIKIGTKVYYYPVALPNGQKDKTKVKKTVITSEPWKLGHGEIVCNIRGVTGCVSIKHLKKSTQQAFQVPGSGCFHEADQTFHI